MSSGRTAVLYRVPARGLERSAIRDFARQLEQEVAKGSPFCCLITSDAELCRLNKQFRRKDYTTDVLSFPSGAANPGRRRLSAGAELGEIAISWDRAKAQAAEYGHTTAEELQILMLHGVLHLTGMDHEKDNGKMARAETRWRKRLNLPTSLIERARS